MLLMNLKSNNIDDGTLVFYIIHFLSCIKTPRVNRVSRTVVFVVKPTARTLSRIVGKNINMWDMRLNLLKIVIDMLKLH